MFGLFAQIFHHKGRRLQVSQAVGFVSFKVSVCVALLMVAAFSLASPAQASVLDWFSGRSRVSDNADANNGNLAVTMAQPEESIRGENLDAMGFVQQHWSTARNRLHRLCRALADSSNDAGMADIVEKLFIVDTQLFREAIRGNAVAVTEIADANEAIKQNLAVLSQVVTAPGQETLAALNKTLDQIVAANARQLLLVRKYLTGSDRMIQTSSSAYETIMLIPSLSHQALDLLVKTSQQIMRMTQSNSEAFKGLLLNVQNNGEQISSAIESIKQTIRETLRFSDHFAIQQFPLVNLPIPSRERIFVHINSLNNSSKGISNTISIADSQIRNSAQQFGHRISDYVARASESLKFATPHDRPREQISNYARNQVSGLFTRVREDLSEMRKDMEVAARTATGGQPPEVRLESAQDSSIRRARSAVGGKLPMFLLGGEKKTQTALGTRTKESQEAPRVTSARRMPELISPEPGTAKPNMSMAGFKPVVAASSTAVRAKSVRSASTGSANSTTRVLYTESAPAQATDLLQAEMNILQQELGTDFFFGDLATAESSPARRLPTADFGERSFVFDDETSTEDEVYDYAAEDSDSPLDMRLSQSNLNSSVDPEIELLRLETFNDSYSNEVIPLMRIDSEFLNFSD